MKRFAFLSVHILNLFLIAGLLSCSGLKNTGTENDDAYYSQADRRAEQLAAERAAEKSRKESEEAKEKAASAAKNYVQPDYVNPEYKASGEAAVQPSQSQGGNIVTNNYYQNNPRWNWGVGVSPYTSLGYNWMYPGYSGFNWRVSTFWGPMWAGSVYDPWDYGYVPYYRTFYNPYAYNPYLWYNPWYYRPFYRSNSFYGGSYWDNYQGNSWSSNNSGGGNTSGGGRVRTNLPLGGTGTGVYTGNPSGGRSWRSGGREAVVNNSGSNAYSGSGISSGTRDNTRPSGSGFWRRNGNVGSGAGTTSGSSQQGSGQVSSPGSGSGFWRRSSSIQTNSPASETRPSFQSSSGSGYSGSRSQSGTSSGWGSGTTGGRSRSVGGASGGSGPSGGRRR